jgi:Protein of unknown function (DUF1553)/Protein of unknown function (DUF1549)/Planctomycete cytochrome C
MSHWRLFYMCFGLVFVGDFAVDAQHSRAADKPLDFNRDVRPILSEHCFACHGFDEKSRQADLRLDIADSAYSRSAIVPRDLDKSEAWQRIVSKDEDEVMPPLKAHVPLDETEKQILRRWIEQGAEYAGHWSFIAPKKFAIPTQWSDRSPIDAFVLERLKDEGLKPSDEADRATLIRRLTLDLTGLPPSGDEVLAFVHDPSPKAYENLVDRLIASPHFGERLALEWLDAARYADTNGFSIDGGRHIWMWRDWVIQSFNDNLSYDRFLVQQLAGDLLPNTNDTLKIATGFQRNNMVTHEGGTIPEENLANYNADRIKTLGESMMGLTLGCAQCHDHKFDPITQREYYQFFAFFNTLNDKGLDGNGGVNPAPSIQTKTILKTNEVDQLKAQIEKLETKLRTIDKSIQVAWENRERDSLAQRGLNLKTYPVKVLKVSTPNRGSGFEIEEERLVRLKDAGAMSAIDISTELPKIDEPITAIRVIVHPVESLPGGGWGNGPADGKPTRAKPAPTNAKPKPKPTSTPVESVKSELSDNTSNSPTKDAAEPEEAVSTTKVPKGTFMLTALAATFDRVQGDQVNLFKLQSFRKVTANSWELANPPRGCLDPRNQDGWSPDLDSEGSVRLTANLATPVDAHSNPYLTVQLNFGNGRSLIPELVEIQVITGNDDDTDIPKDVLVAIESDDAVRTPEQQKLVWDYCEQHCDELLRERIDLANLKERLAVLTESFTTMVMDVAAKPRETFILNRGDYSQPKEKVAAGTLKSLPPMREGSNADRLGLAEWLVMKEHPLTARVAVNRFWKMLFGTGIVGTPADFGSQGEWPSHPELLDWLAVDFIENEWDVKRLIKQIVLSSTYRQSSASTPQRLERDPQNRLLARGPRFRLPAEFIRDAALKVSGLLVPRIGGPSVNPYAPGDLWREVSHYGSTPATAQTFVQDHGEKLYRRSLYTFWKRTAPPPNMVAFDAPNREVCTIARGNTTTPLQALVTLNDVQFVEASRAFAARIIQASAKSDTQKLEWAFLEATSRPSTTQELSILKRTLLRERERYRANIELAKTSVDVGEAALPNDIPFDELAAWSQVAAILLNLSESVICP